MNMDNNSMAKIGLPGFRFHPTEEELLSFYLKKISMGKKLPSDVIGFLNIYRHDPWELPGLAKIGEREWYFFVHRDKKNGHGGRSNRTTENGFWKATGSDRPIRSSSEPKKVLGLKKTLVFYTGRAPRGTKTDWIMNEYRLPDDPLPKEDAVLCKIYRKATSLKILEQRAAMGDQSTPSNTSCSMSSQLQETPQIISCKENSSIVDSFLFQKESFGPSRRNEKDDQVLAVNNIIPSAIFSMDVAKDSSWWIPLLWNLEQCSPLANMHA